MILTHSNCQGRPRWPAVQSCLASTFISISLLLLSFSLGATCLHLLLVKGCWVPRGTGSKCTRASAARHKHTRVVALEGSVKFASLHCHGCKREFETIYTQFWLSLDAIHGEGRKEDTFFPKENLVGRQQDVAAVKNVPHPPLQARCDPTCPDCGSPQVSAAPTTGLWKCQQGL